jgi:acetylornithine deacetylase/succinyl-diaminopimelate desuccinylase-like protein
MAATPAEQILNRTWRPALSLVGMDGIPATADAGNVLRPFTKAKLSIRIPPTCDAERAAAAVVAALEEDPPHGVNVTCTVADIGPGWNAPETAPWLAAALDEASIAAFGNPARYVGEGGTIPFMGMLGERFPAAQFLITGVLGPGTNAHGPNEYFHIPTAKRVTAAVAHVVDAHARR